MKNYVYWYHLPSHTDHTKEGYIGVTNSLERRHYEHSTGKSNSPKLCNAFNKYGDLIQKKVIYSGTELECLALEKQLRPSENIGWNICVGGGKAPDPTGRIHSLATRIKRTNSLRLSKQGKVYPSKFKGITDRYTKAQREHIGSFHKGKIITEKHKRSMHLKLLRGNSVLAKKVYLFHIDDPTKIREFSSIGTVADELNLNYSAVRSAFQTVNRTKLCTKPNSKGWCTIHESVKDNPLDTLVKYREYLKKMYSTIPKASGAFNHKSKEILMENTEGILQKFPSINQAAKYIGLSEATLRYHVNKTLKTEQDSGFNSKGWKVKYNR